MLCRAMSRPTTALMDAALRVLAYLNKHKQVGLRYQHGTQRRLEGYSDADWAVQRSQSGFGFTLGRALISWGSKRQPVVALSTCKSELMAATEAAKEAVHLRRLHAELTFEDNPPPTHLHLDNMGAIDTAYNHAHHSRMKYCDRKVFWVLELVEDHKIVVPFVASDKNIADFLTKPLPAKKFLAIRKVIMNEC